MKADLLCLAPALVKKAPEISLAEACATWTTCHTWHAGNSATTVAVPSSTISGERIREAGRAVVVGNAGGEDAAADGVGAVESPAAEGPAVGQVRAGPTFRSGRWCMTTAGGPRRRMAMALPRVAARFLPPSPTK